MLNKKVKLSLISDYRSAIMGVGALFIVIFHLWLSLFSKIAYVSTIERVIKNICYCGVDIFFLVSGLGLYYSLKKNRDVKQFYKRRFPKFILPWILTAVLTALTSNWSITTFIENVTGYSFFAKSIYLFKWYVIAICLVYLLFPIYFNLFEKSRHKGIFTASFILIWIVGAILIDARVDFYGILWRIPVFVLGVYLEHLILNDDKSVSVWLIWLIFAAGVVIFYLNFTKLIKINIVEPNSLLANSLLAVSISYLVGMLCQNHDKLTKTLSLIGNCSLEMYLFQELIGLPLISLTGKFLPKIVINLLVIAAVVICCYYLNKLFTYLNRKIFKQ
ncbi:MAG: acyltransferase family protein [Erysipelotrichaceae bacterium]